MSRIVAVVAPVLLAVPSVAPAADQLVDAVRDAVATHNLRETDVRGNAAARSPYRDGASDGAVLAGLEVALGGSAPNERIVAVRPVYRMGGRDRTGAPAGRFLSDEVTRTVRMIARPGYAVTGLSVSAAGRLDGLSVRYARIDRAGLDPADAYESPWVGSAGADGPAALGGEGMPVVGVFGRLEAEAVVAIGLTIADLPRPIVAPVATHPAPVPTLALERDKPTKAVPAKSSGGRVWVLVVLAGGVVTAGLLFARARRRRRRGVQQLPRLSRERRWEPSREGPPSIPGRVMPSPLVTTTPPPATHPTQLESDYVWR